MQIGLDIVVVVVNVKGVFLKSSLCYKWPQLKKHIFMLNKMLNIVKRDI